MQDALPQAAGSQSRPVRTAVVILIAAALLFMIAGYGMRRLANVLDPLPLAIGDLVTKLRLYEATREDVDTLVLGTSRVAFSVNPAALDQESKARGCETHTFNLAAPGIRYPGYLYLLQFLARDPPPRLRRILFEPNVNQMDRRWDILYVRHFLALTHISDYIREAIANPNVDAERWTNIGYLILAYAYQNTGISGVSEALVSNQTDDPASFRQGFKPADQSYGAPSIHKGAFPADDEGKTFASLLKDWSPSEYDRPQTGDWAHVVKMEYDALAPINAEKRPLIPPSVYYNQPAMIAALAQSGHDGRTLFVGPDTAPQLYNTDFWFDSGHLNDKGSVIYSKILAQRLCAEALARRGS